MRDGLRFPVRHLLCVAVFLLVFGVSGCGDSADNAACQQGEDLSCTCEDGRTGTLDCTSDAAAPSCACTEEPGSGVSDAGRSGTGHLDTGQSDDVHSESDHSGDGTSDSDRSDGTGHHEDGSDNDSDTDTTADGGTDTPSDGGMDTSSDAGTDTPSEPTDGSGGGSGTPACSEPLVPCGDECVDTRTDAGNCGECGFVCPAPSGQQATCTQGSCDDPCQESGLQLCGSICTSILVDYAHCGGCHQACPDDAACSDGTCLCMNDSLDVCDTSCVDLQVDPLHCGSCDHGCPAGVNCISGGCACDDGGIMCGGACVDPRTDDAHCGACGEGCGTGQWCVGGTCVCTNCAHPLVGRDLEDLDYDAFRIRQGCTTVSIRARMPSSGAMQPLGHRPNGMAFVRGEVAPEPGQLIIETGSGPDSPCAAPNNMIESGGLDWIELTLDGRTWRYQLPPAGPLAPISYPALYPAVDGHLYFDQALLMPATPH